MARMEEATQSRTAAEVLTRSRSVIEPSLRRAVGTLPSSMRHIAGYHFGWWDQDGRMAEGDGGKAIRPALALLTAEAVGGVSAEALPAAMAVELVHNFSLLHDDVMDKDIARRHRPTAWKVFGEGAAILAGDALLTLAHRVLAESAHPAAREGSRILSATVLALVDGQSADLAFEERDDVCLPDCLHMAAAKTGALLSCACALGALFGAGSPQQVEHLRAFGEHLGMAFQIVDDLLGIWGDPATTGKPVHSDLNSRKKTIPVVIALTSGTAAGRELATLYESNGSLSGPQRIHAAQLIDASGARTCSQSHVEEQLAAALGDLWSADPSPRAAAELYALARFATRRNR